MPIYKDGYRNKLDYFKRSIKIIIIIIIIIKYNLKALLGLKERFKESLNYLIRIK